MFVGDEQLERKIIIRISVVVVLLIVLLMIVVVVMKYLLDVRKLEIVNFDQVSSSLSSERKRELEDYVWQVLSSYNSVSADQENVKAIIRPNSYSEINTDGDKLVAFTVDIDDYKVTFNVSVSLMKDGSFYEVPYIECASKDLTKYSGSYCNSGRTSSFSVDIGKELPYYFSLDDGRLVTVTGDYSDYDEEFLKVRVSSCGDNEIIELARNRVIAWVESLGFSSDWYRITIPEYCDGEMK